MKAFRLLTERGNLADVSIGQTEEGWVERVGT